VLRKLLSVVLVLAGLAATQTGASAQAGKTKFTVRIENISGAKASAFKTVGIFNKPIGAIQPGAATPGQAFEFIVSAVAGDRLSFTSMFGQSNDWFFGVSDKGLPLYDSAGKPVSGDFSSEIRLWDAGTEVDEEPGSGPNQGPRQSGPNTGPAENGVVHLVSDIKTGITTPNAADYLKLTVTSLEKNLFRIHIDNISAKAKLPTPVSPGVFVIHTSDAPIFAKDEKQRGQGLENQSEDGNPVLLARALGTTDKTIRVSPGVFVVHTKADPIFTTGQTDRAQGLENLAEDGNPTNLAKSVESGGFVTTGVYNMPVGADKAGAIAAGQAFEFSFTAEQGSYLSFVSMFGDSNDLFFSPGGNGIALFNAKGKPVNGDVSIHVQLWDAGTEVNQEPFVGADQAPRQKAPNTGASEKLSIQLVQEEGDGFTYPSVFGMIKVTITAENGVVMNMMEPAMMAPAGMMQPEPTLTK